MPLPVCRPLPAPVTCLATRHSPVRLHSSNHKRARAANSGLPPSRSSFAPSSTPSSLPPLVSHSRPRCFPPFNCVYWSCTPTLLLLLLRFISRGHSSVAPRIELRSRLNFSKRQLRDRSDRAFCIATTASYGSPETSLFRAELERSRSLAALYVGLLLDIGRPITYFDSRPEVFSR